MYDYMCMHVHVHVSESGRFVEAGYMYMYMCVSFPERICCVPISHRHCNNKITDVLQEVMLHNICTGRQPVLTSKVHLIARCT